MANYKIAAILLFAYQFSYAFIINGSPVKERFPEVGVFYYYGMQCTITKIGPKQFLTAAHCLENHFNHINIRFKERHTLHVKSFNVHPSWKEGCYYFGKCNGSEVGTSEMIPGRADIALINVKEFTEDIPIMTIRRQSVPINSAVTMVGYGCDLDIYADSESVNQMTMRYGNSVTVSENELKNSSYEDIKNITAQSNIITYGYGYDSKYSSLCLGDSGGPLLIQNKQSQWQMVGVATHYTFTEDGKKTGHSYTNLHTRLDINSYHNIYDWIKNNIEN